MSIDIPTTDLLSARDLAADLGVTSATVRRWVRMGRLQPTQITYGGYYRFSAADARNQLEGLRFVRKHPKQPDDATPEDHAQAVLDSEE